MKIKFAEIAEYIIDVEFARNADYKSQNRQIIELTASLKKSEAENQEYVGQLIIAQERDAKWEEAFGEQEQELSLLKDYQVKSKFPEPVAKFSTGKECIEINSADYEPSDPALKGNLREAVIRAMMLLETYYELNDLRNETNSAKSMLSKYDALMAAHSFLQVGFSGRHSWAGADAFFNKCVTEE